MIEVQVELYNPRRRRYRRYLALIDTGATACAIAQHIAVQLGLPTDETSSHLWQIGGPLTLQRTQIEVRYSGRSYKVGAMVVEVPDGWRRLALPEEECTRPARPHPLATCILLGENFFSQLPEQDRQSIGLR